MTSSYWLRLVCLSLAVLFLVHLGMGLAVALCTPAVVRRAERWRAAAAARWMLGLRLLPAACAVFVVCAICIPSYLRLEPEAMQEKIGLACLAAAVLGAAAWGFSLARAACAVARSMRQVRQWRERGTETAIGDMRVWTVKGAGRTVALAGIFRPKLIVSREIVEALPADQLAAALRHEQAHSSARDNFKRLLMLLAPDLVSRGQLERAWVRFTEWSADDRAADGGERRSVRWAAALAAALVSVARMGSASVTPLATSLTTNAGDLQVRVDRLLERREDRPVPATLVAGCLLAAVALLTLTLLPGTLSVAHRILEGLVD